MGSPCWIPGFGKNKNKKTLFIESKKMDLKEQT